MGTKQNASNTDIDKHEQPDGKIRELQMGWSTYLDNAPDGVYLSDLRGTFLYGNKKAEQIMGYKREELVGSNYLKLHILPTRYLAKAAKLLALNLLGRSTGPDELELITKDGTRIMVEITTTPVKEHGKVIVVGFVRDITERMQAQEKIERIAKEWQSTFDSITDFVSIQDRDFKLVRVNKAYADVFHMKPEELVGKKCYQVVHKKSCPIENCPHEKALKTKESAMAEVFEPSLGVFLEIFCYPIFNEQGEVNGTIHIAKNSTERKQIKDALTESEELFRSVSENSHTGIFVTQDNKFIYVNDRFAQMHGYQPDEMLGKEAWITLPAEDRERVEKQVSERMSGKFGPNTIIRKRIKKDGTDFWAEQIMNTIRYKGKPAFMGNILDITERKQLQQKLEEAAGHDALTGLPNRRLLYDRFDIALANAQRKKKRLSILSLDLDRFKAINDTLGHDVGDKLLIAAGSRLTSILRKVDTVARIGGDEFALLLWDVDHKEDAVKVAQKIVEEFRRPFLIDGHTLNNTVSFGVAIYPEDGKSIEDLLKNSDKSLYRVKESGRDNYQFST